MPGVVGRVLGRLFGRRPRGPREPGPSPVLASRAADIILRHAEAHATLFERAERLTEKSARLEEAGTPSDSATNRAARAREEVEAGLTALRDSFVASEGEAGGAAFDEEVGRRYPALGLKTTHQNA